MELFLGLIFGAVLGVYLGISIAREKPSDYEDIGDSVERVGRNYVYGLDASLDDTTPPQCADETYTPQEPTIWDIEIEKYFSKESE
jgi:hypothetical protein